jgi:hypothetical protein
MVARCRVDTSDCRDFWFDGIGQMAAIPIGGCMSMEKELAKAVEENVAYNLKYPIHDPVENTTAQPREQTVNRISQLTRDSTTGGGTNAVRNQNAHNPIEAVARAVAAATRLEELAVATCTRLCGAAGLHPSPFQSPLGHIPETTTVARIDAMVRDIEARLAHSQDLLERIRTTFS